MGVKSTQTITRADAESRYVKAYVQLKTNQRRAKTEGLIEEAELWLLRHRLLSGGAIGLRRWHATLRR